MKFYLKLAAVILVLVGILYWLQLQEETPAPPSAVAPATAAVQTPAPEALPTTPVPSQPTPAAQDETFTLIAGTAKRSNVAIASMTRQNANVLVTVTARERNHLGDFLDECLKAGMKDVEQVRGAYRQTVDRQGRTHYQDTYRIKF
jgi:cytoskeletal protein RodZ